MEISNRTPTEASSDTQPNDSQRHSNVTVAQMTNENARTEPAMPLSPTSFGGQFQRARTTQGKTLEDATKELHILKRHLEAIEREDFASLPQMPFTRGFVFNYAKYLGLNSEKMVERFNEVYPEDLRQNSQVGVRSPIQPMGTLSRDSKRGFRINPLLILGLVFLIGLGVFLLRTITNAQNAEADADTVVLTDDMSDSEQLAGASVSTNDVDNAPSQSSGSALNLGTENSGTDGDANGDTEITTSSTENTQTTPALDAQTLASTPESKLEFWVRNDTNVSVVDASGQSLLSGLQSRGGYNLTGKPPFRIQIDKANNVALTIDQARVNIGDYAQNNQANFTLSP